MNLYGVESPTACGACECVQTLSRNRDKTLGFLFDDKESTCRLFDSGDHNTTVSLFVLKRLLNTLKSDIAQVGRDPLYDSKLIGLLSNEGESLRETVKRYCLPRNQRDSAASRARETGIFASDDGFLSDEGVRHSTTTTPRAIVPQRTQVRKEFVNRSIQVTPRQHENADKSTLTESAKLADKCCGSLRSIRDLAVQATASICETGTNTELPSSTRQSTADCHNGQSERANGVDHADVEATPNSHCSANNASGSTDSSSNFTSELSIGEISFAKAVAHLIRTECGLLVFNADGSLLTNLASNSSKRREECAESRIDRSRQHSSPHRSASQAVRVMECDDPTPYETAHSPTPSRLNYFYRDNNIPLPSAMGLNSANARVNSIGSTGAGSSTGDNRILVAKEISIISSSYNSQPFRIKRGGSTESSDEIIEEVLANEGPCNQNDSKSTLTTGSAMMGEEEESTLNQISPLPSG